MPDPVRKSLDIVQPSAGQNRGRLTEGIAGKERPSSMTKEKEKARTKTKEREKAEVSARLTRT